jgi:hypothetical protein
MRRDALGASRTGRSDGRASGRVWSPAWTGEALLRSLGASTLVFWRLRSDRLRISWIDAAEAAKEKR